MNTTTQLRKERQRRNKEAREQIVADRRHDAEIQARIARQGKVFYFKVNYSWYKTEKGYTDFAQWYERYFGIRCANVQVWATFRHKFGDNPPVAFDVDRVGY